MMRDLEFALISAAMWFVCWSVFWWIGGTWITQSKRPPRFYWVRRHLRLTIILGWPVGFGICYAVIQLLWPQRLGWAGVVGVVIGIGLADLVWVRRYVPVSWED